VRGKTKVNGELKTTKSLSLMFFIKSIINFGANLALLKENKKLLLLTL